MNQVYVSPLRVLYSLLVATVLFVGACYSAGDLGAEPFRCNRVYPDCPTDYVCAFTINNLKIPNCANPANCVCVKVCQTDADCPLSLPQGTCQLQASAGISLCR